MFSIILNGLPSGIDVFREGSALRDTLSTARNMSYCKSIVLVSCSPSGTGYHITYVQIHQLSCRHPLAHCRVLVPHRTPFQVLLLRRKYQIKQLLAPSTVQPPNTVQPRSAGIPFSETWRYNPNDDERLYAASVGNVSRLKKAGPNASTRPWDHG